MSQRVGDNIPLDIVKGSAQIKIYILRIKVI